MEAEKNKKCSVFMMVRVSHLIQSPACALKKKTNNNTEKVVLKWTKTLYENNTYEREQKAEGKKLLREMSRKSNMQEVEYSDY